MNILFPDYPRKLVYNERTHFTSARYNLHLQRQDSPIFSTATDDLTMSRRKHEEAFPTDSKNDDAQADGDRKRIRPFFNWGSLVRKPPTRECSVCVSDLPMDQFPPTIHSETAQHKSEVCKSCWEEHLRIAVEEVETNRIRCAQCDTVLNEPEVHLLASQEVHSK